MKKLILLMWAVISATCAMADNDTVVYHYKGYVGPYAITMTLRETPFLDGDWWRYDYEGSYTYTKAGNTLKLSGSSMSGEIFLTETTRSGKESASWLLNHDSGSYDLVGTMRVLKNDKTYEVRLKEVP